MINKQPEHPHISTYEDPIDYLYREPIDRITRVQDLKMLIVTWREIESEISFIVISSSHNIPEDGGKIVFASSLGNIKEYLENIAQFLKKAGERIYTSDSSRESLLQNIEGMGKGLFEALIPAELRAMIQSWPESAWLSISSNEQWIPWELLHDGQGFLGRRFMLFRIPRRALYSEEFQDRQKNPRTNLPNKIVHVIGGNIDENLAHVCERYFTNVNNSIEVQILREITLSDLMQAIENTDILHLTCHGYLNPLRLQITKTDDELITLTISSLKASRFTMRTGGLVFANACSSAAAELQFGEFVNFGWEFYLKGAAVFIGTLGTIPTEMALTFAETFYNVLSSDKGGDICRAYHIAHEKLHQDSPMPLLYCFYGNPLSIPDVTL